MYLDALVPLAEMEGPWLWVAVGVVLLVYHLAVF